jgi:hypothetical protein
MNDKSIADKMYLKNAKSLAIFNGQVHPAVTAQMPQQLLDADAPDGVDVALIFALNQAQMEQYFPEAMARLGEKGSLWIAYLKHSAPKATDINRDIIYTWAKLHGATGVAMISVDADWSAVRLKRL